MSKSEVLVSISKVSMNYSGENGETKALDEISLDINRGEFVCVLGPSGCGKSTLLKIIAGFNRPTTGSLTMNGEPIRKPNWHRGVVFQSPTLYPWLNVFQNVEYGLKMRKLPKEERKEIVEKYLELVGLAEFAKQKPYELSGGMKQRASLARILVNQPEMILMDEPFGALDALTRQNMQTLTRQIWTKTGNTIFLITHDVDEALSLGTSIIVMSERPGKILKKIEVDFSRQIAENPKCNARYTEEYKNIREEILEMINTQTNGLKAEDYDDNSLFS